MPSRRLPLNIRAFYQNGGSTRRLHADSSDSIYSVTSENYENDFLKTPSPSSAPPPFKYLVSKQYPGLAASRSLDVDDEDSCSVTLQIQREQSTVASFYCTRSGYSCIGKCILVGIQLVIAVAVFAAIAVLLATHSGQPKKAEISIDIHTTITCNDQNCVIPAAESSKNSNIGPPTGGHGSPSHQNRETANSEMVIVTTDLVHKQSTVAHYVPTTAASSDASEENVSRERGDCMDLLKYHGATTSGHYWVIINGVNKTVYCDMTTEGGGWTSIQRRINGGVRFDKNWRQYKDGFGDPNGDYWLGLEALHFLTNQPDLKQSLRIELKSCSSVITNETQTCSGVSSVEYVQATYKTFRVDNETRHYALHLGQWSGCLNDSIGNLDGIEMHAVSGVPFCTHDRNNAGTKFNVVERTTGGWWIWKAMPEANPNGIFNSNCKGGAINGIYWHNWTPLFARTVEMKIRPSSKQ